jgi:hypothetical protein
MLSTVALDIFLVHNNYLHMRRKYRTTGVHRRRKYRTGVGGYLTSVESDMNSICIIIILCIATNVHYSYNIKYYLRLSTLIHNSTNVQGIKKANPCINGAQSYIRW